MSKNTRCFREISQKKYIKIDFIIVRNNAGTQILPLMKKVIVFHNPNKPRLTIMIWSTSSNRMDA